MKEKHYLTPLLEPRSVGIIGASEREASLGNVLMRNMLEAGYKVGLHTSPHLISFNERARINGEQATDAQLLPHFFHADDVISAVKHFLDLSCLVRVLRRQNDRQLIEFHFLSSLF